MFHNGFVESEKKHQALKQLGSAIDELVDITREKIVVVDQAAYERSGRIRQDPFTAISPRMKDQMRKGWKSLWDKKHWKSLWEENFEWDEEYQEGVGRIR